LPSAKVARGSRSKRSQASSGPRSIAGDQAIDGVGLIEGALGQRRVQPAVDLADANAFVDIGQDVVELADLDGRTAQAAALGGAGVGVVEMLEAGG
jgi:hypothetical protein